MENIETSRSLLPADTNFVAIEGGNHAQFGWYGPQSGDLPATISHPDQHTQTVVATVALLDTVKAQREASCCVPIIVQEIAYHQKMSMLSH